MNATWKEKLFWSFYACALVLLYLMSSTNLIIKEKKKEIYRVSVIVEDSKDDYYINMKKGMDQAAVEYNVDVNFITLYERNHSSQQMGMVRREMEMGTQAVILAPVDSIKTASVLDSMSIDMPLIILNNEEPSGNKITANVAIDSFAGGQKMAEEISKDITPETSVYLFTEGLQYGSNRQLYDGIMSILPDKGYSVTLIEKAFRNRYQDMLNEWPAKEKNRVIIALDTESLTEIAALLEVEPEKFEAVKLYGRGSTLKILRYMERGMIKGILAENMYDAGYISMEEAVNAIENRGIKEKRTLESFFLRKSDITKKDYEKMLYPIY